MRFTGYSFSSSAVVAFGSKSGWVSRFLSFLRPSRALTLHRLYYTRQMVNIFFFFFVCRYFYSLYIHEYLRNSASLGLLVERIDTIKTNLAVPKSQQKRQTGRKCMTENSDVPPGWAAYDPPCRFFSSPSALSWLMNKNDNSTMPAPTQ